MLTRVENTSFLDSVNTGARRNPRFNCNPHPPFHPISLETRCVSLSVNCYHASHGMYSSQEMLLGLHGMLLGPDGRYRDEE